MSFADQLRTPPGSQRGKSPDHRYKLDLIIDELEQRDPAAAAALLAAIQDPQAWPNLPLSNALAAEGYDISYESIRTYRRRRLWERR